MFKSILPPSNAASIALANAFVTNVSGGDGVLRDADIRRAGGYDAIMSYLRDNDLSDAGQHVILNALAGKLERDRFGGAALARLQHSVLTGPTLGGADFHRIAVPAAMVALAAALALTFV